MYLDVFCVTYHLHGKPSRLVIRTVMHLSSLMLAGILILKA